MRLLVVHKVERRWWEVRVGSLVIPFFQLKYTDCKKTQTGSAPRMVPQINPTSAERSSSKLCLGPLPAEREKISGVTT